MIKKIQEKKEETPTISEEEVNKLYLEILDGFGANESVKKEELKKKTLSCKI